MLDRPLIEVIELGLNCLAQDLIGNRHHTNKDIKKYISYFPFYRLGGVEPTRIKAISKTDRGGMKWHLK